MPLFIFLLCNLVAMVQVSYNLMLQTWFKHGLHSMHIKRSLSHFSLRPCSFSKLITLVYVIIHMHVLHSAFTNGLEVMSLHVLCLYGTSMSTIGIVIYQLAI